MARKDNSPAISFFSFQDIITSITGIMFLVVLILVLLVVSRTKSAPAAKVDQSVTRLQQHLKQLQLQAAAQAAGQKQLQQRLEELKKLDAASLPRKKEQLLQQLRQSAVLLAQQDRTLDELEKEKKQLETQLKALDADRKKQLQGNWELEQLLQQEAAAKKQKQLELAKNSKLVKFVWEHDIGKKPLLVLCGKEGLSVQDGKSGKELYTGKNDGDEPAMLAQFVAWCRSAGNVYVVLLAKPSGFSYVEELSRLLAGAGIERGREVLPSEDGILQGGVK